MATKHFITLALFLCAFSAHADNTLSLQFNGLSYHYDRTVAEQYELQERNPGVGLTLANSRWLGTAGYYDNSYSETTVYALAGPVWQPYEWLRFGLLAGAVTGYEIDTGMAVTPALVPMMSVWRVNVIVTPFFVAANLTVARF